MKESSEKPEPFLPVVHACNVDDIDVSTIVLNDTIPVYLLNVPAPHPVPTEIGDYDEDDIPDLMVKFDGDSVVSYIWISLEIKMGDATLTVSGQLDDGTSFEASDAIRVIFADDVNGDGEVDIIDLSVIGRNYGVTIGEQSYHEREDLNSDGVIDTRDLAITAVNYGATTPQ